MVLLSDMDVESCARAAHAVNCQFCSMIGDTVLGPWESLPEQRRAGIIAGVVAALADPPIAPGDSHRGWLATMAADGWVYGPVRDEAAKVHPCMVPYEDLPPAQRAKDAQFLAVVRAHAAALAAARPAGR